MFSVTMQHTATHCNTLQHTATHCNALQHTATHCNALQRTATHCNTLQHSATHSVTHCNSRVYTWSLIWCVAASIQYAYTFINASPFKNVYILQGYPYTHFMNINTFERVNMGAICTHSLQHTTTYCNILQHTATHCNALLHRGTICAHTGHTCVWM